MTEIKELSREQKRLVAKAYDECRDLAAAAECWSRVDPRFKSQEATSSQAIKTAVCEARMYGVPEEVLNQLREVLPARLRHLFPDADQTPTKR